MDRFLIYAPNWVKNCAAILLVVLFATAFGVSAHALVTGENRDLIAPAFSAAQAAGVGIIILGVISFTERDASPKALLAKSKGWLLHTLKGALERVTLDGRRLSVDITETPEDIFIKYRVRDPRTPADALEMHVFLNVKRLWVYYLFPSSGGDDAERVAQAVQVTFEGAKGAGYEWTQVKHPARVEYHLSAPIDADFLMKPTEQLYWAQDIASMTRSLIASAQKNRMPLTLAPAQA
ncbi:hypothetical protein [Candidatus Viadribacter manganicus]|uniref:Uncharacterized protein n=1 Tax=Candidatus Viadribacter manganicus TaxID=1759059 RepID=A0A1B1AEK0_9PROT|nr:hypothetical protein [Candidatus Viadribacter manganicus]ANP44975.1 hypothetical protein ATE48_03065 [Candidatus Viadribacter manganicus]